jgi:hypothetical protein
MAEVVRQFDEQEPKPFRLVEGEKKLHFIELSFPGLEGTVLPTLEYLKGTIVHALEADLRKKLMNYLQGLLVALPRKIKSTKAFNFRKGKWRKNTQFQQKCAELGLELPHTVQEVHSSWYAKITRTKRVTGSKKYETQVLGEELRRELSEEEKELLKKTKKFLEAYKQILEKYEERRSKEFETKKDTIRSQIEDLGVELERKRKEYLDDLNRTRQEYEELVRKKRELIAEVVSDLEKKRAEKVRELSRAEINQALEGKLEAVWAKMRIDGELKEW